MRMDARRTGQPRRPDCHMPPTTHTTTPRSGCPLHDLHRRDYHPVHYGLHARASRCTLGTQPGRGLCASGRYVACDGWVGWVGWADRWIIQPIKPIHQSSLTPPYNAPTLQTTGYQAIAVLSCGIILPFRQIWCVHG